MIQAAVPSENNRVSRSRWAKQATKRMLGSALLYPVLHRLSDARNGITILTYHALGPDQEPFDAWVVARIGDFTSQIASLRERYEVVSLDAASRSSAVGRSVRPQAVVTFDDGHSSLFQYLLPLAQQLELPVTVYVSTGHVQDQRLYWFDQLVNALQLARPAVLDLSHHDLGHWRVGETSGEEYWNEIGPLFEALKRLSPSKRELVLRSSLEQLGRYPRRDVTPLWPMSIDQVRVMGQSPWITIGAHSHCHSLLDQLPLVEAEASMRRSRELLRDWTGQEVRHFAFPNGNFTPELQHAAQRVGFASAVTTQPGVWTAVDSPYALPRVSIGRYDGVDGLKWSLLRARGATRAGSRPDSQVHQPLGR